MTTASLKNDQLPNNRLEVFKSNITNQQNERNFEQSTDIIELKLLLQNNSEINIPVSKDGYVNCTKLCQAGNKRIDNWNRLKQSKELIEAYSKLPHFRGSLILRSINGKNGGTYYPIDIAIQIAQWCSSSFALQVSRWTRELLLFGKVELGQEKSNKELENKFQEQIKLLTQEKQQAIEEKEQVIIEKETIARRFTSLTQNHNKMLKRRIRGVYEIGNVVYIISHIAFTTYYKDDYYKIGISTQTMTETTPAFTNRLTSYKTGAPLDYKVHYLIYVENNKLIEDIIKLKYKNQLNPSNGEWIKSVKLEEIINSIRHLCNYIGLPCKEHRLIKNKNIVDDGKLLHYEDDKIDSESDDEKEQEEINIEIIDSENEEQEEKSKEMIESEINIEIINSENEEEESKEMIEQEINIEIIDSENEEEESEEIEMIEEINKYDGKQLTQMLLQFKLPTSGTKDEKKERIRTYSEKNKKMVDEYISGVMEKEKQNFCIDCKIEISYKAARCEICSKKSFRLVPDRPDYETLKKQYQDCGKNMIALGNIYNITSNAVKKWFVKYEKDLGITKTCLKQIKPKSLIKKPTGNELLHDKNVLTLNFSQIAKKYNVDRKTVSSWLKSL